MPNACVSAEENQSELFILAIKLIEKMVIKCIQHAKQMDEETFPYPQFKFMHQINNEHLEVIES